MVTIKDIARIAGVSVTTVSRALNDYEDVNKETKRRIREIADSLDYMPNAVARSLVSKRTNTIGVILSGITFAEAKGNFVFEILCGINDRSSEMNYDILLFMTNSNKQRMKSYYNLCKERNVDGAIIFGLKVDDPYLKEVVEKSTFPCVLIDIPYSNKKLGYVSTDNVEGAMKAVQHLIELGHTNIAMINGHCHADVSEKRLQGYKQAIVNAGIKFDESIIMDGNFTEQGGEQAMYRILKENPGVTAVFCASDLMAVGAMEALKKMGRNVPDSVSVAGYDDITLASHCTPKLTTIHQDRYKMGWSSAQLLIDMLDGNAINHHVILESNLIVRQSTKKQYSLANL